MPVKSNFNCVTPGGIKIPYCVPKITPPVPDGAAIEPEATEPGLRKTVAGAVAEPPNPLNATVVEGAVGSLLAMVNVPLCTPALAGVKRTAICDCAPAAMVSGNVGETIVNCGLLEVMPLMVDAVITILYIVM